MGSYEQKSKFYYWDKIPEGRIKQISRENGLLFSEPSYTCKSLIKLFSGHRSQVQHLFSGTSRNCLYWKLLSRKGAEHRAIIMFNCPNNLFTHSFNVVLNREHHDRSTDNARKAFSNRNWGLWTSKWMDFLLKKAICNVTIWLIDS